MRDAPVDAEIIRVAVQLACRAPSLHNSQPWRWVAPTVPSSCSPTRHAWSGPRTAPAANP